MFADTHILSHEVACMLNIVMLNTLRIIPWIIELIDQSIAVPNSSMPKILLHFLGLWSHSCTHVKTKVAMIIVEM